MDSIEKAINELSFYIKGQMMFSSESDDGDSCKFHNLTHKDTEILGAFCDITNIHGENLMNVLIKGYLNK